MKNIVLVGLMGCGKTTVGKAITEKINGFEFVDIDDELIGVPVGDFAEKVKGIARINAEAQPKNPRRKSTKGS